MSFPLYLTDFQVEKCIVSKRIVIGNETFPIQSDDKAQSKEWLPRGGSDSIQAKPHWSRAKVTAVALSVDL